MTYSNINKFMELSPKQQGLELIQKAKKILLVTKKNPTADSISSLLATGLVLEKLNKEIDMVAPGQMSSLLKFLPNFGKVKDNVKGIKNFIITLDTTETKIDQFSYDFDKDGNKLNIYVTPKDGNYDSKHITSKTIGFQYDLIVCLNSPDLESLGFIYDQNAELFYETPIINIDNGSSNEQFGEVNIVDMKSSSTAEVLHSFFEYFDDTLVDANVATCLLSSIIATTKSFRTAGTTPKSFTLASELITQGADQQKIISNLYKNKSLDSLKLWGRALARVKFDEGNKLVWTMITKDDFKKTNCSDKELLGLDDELASSVSEAEMIMILFEKDNKILSQIKVLKKSNLDNLANCLKVKPQNDVLNLDYKDKSLLETESELINKIKKTYNTGG